MYFLNVYNTINTRSFYRIYQSKPHTREELAFEVIFVREDVEFAGIK